MIASIFAAVATAVVIGVSIIGIWIGARPRPRADYDRIRRLERELLNDRTTFVGDEFRVPNRVVIRGRKRYHESGDGRLVYFDTVDGRPQSGLK